MFNITGNTYPVKDQLKAIGCRWSVQQKCWTTTSEAIYRQGMALVNGTGRMAKSSYRPQHNQQGLQDPTTATLQQERQ